VAVMTRTAPARPESVLAAAAPNKSLPLVPEYGMYDFLIFR
jgi:hypothetical protein